MSGKSGLMGRFIKAVERISEVQDEASHDKAIEMHVMLSEVHEHVTSMYSELWGAVENMRDGYSRSKANPNPIMRYGEWRRLIRTAISTDNDIRDKVRLPEQRDTETPLDYSVKVAHVLQRDLGRHKLTQEQLHKKYGSKSAQEINKANSDLQYEIHKTLKKYFVLRSLINGLEASYEDSKVYPIIPRYSMLKHMMKELFRNKEFILLLQETFKPD